LIPLEAFTSNRTVHSYLQLAFPCLAKPLPAPIIRPSHADNPTPGSLEAVNVASQTGLSSSYVLMTAQARRERSGMAGMNVVLRAGITVLPLRATQMPAPVRPASRAPAIAGGFRAAATHVSHIGRCSSPS